MTRGKGVFISYLQYVLLEKEIDWNSSIFFSSIDKYQKALYFIYYHYKYTFYTTYGFIVF